MNSLLFEKGIGWKKSSLPSVLQPFHRVSEHSEKANNFVKWYSKYNTAKISSKTATLNSCMIKAIDLYLGNVEGKGAVGLINEKLSVAEYQEQEGSCVTVVFNSNTEQFECLTSDGSTLCFNSAEKFCITPFILALLPFLIKDDELDEAMQRLKEKDILNEPEDLLLICDNIYRRIEAGDFVVKIPPDGTIWPLNKNNFENGTYAPETVIAGQFIQQELNISLTENKRKLTIKEAKKKFWSEKDWTEEEKMLVPMLNDDMVVPSEVIEILNYIVKTGEDITPARNFMLRGITGYGKSTIVNMIGAVSNTPVVRVTCHPTMETSDFLTKFVPCVSDGTMACKNLPSFEDIAYDPETAYTMITGKEKPGITPQECLEVYAKSYAASQSSGPSFKLVESDYVKGLSRGWIIEVQEPSVILNSGVLAGLNEYDHVNSVIPMPDGTYRRRDKDAVVIYTDNVTYEGCRQLNQSVIRRNFMAFDLYNMSKKDIISRVVYNTKFNDMKTLNVMYATWKKIQDYCQENAITDGSVSIVELENWALAMRVSGDLYETCKRTVISKATAFIEEQQDIISSVWDVMGNE